MHSVSAHILSGVLGSSNDFAQEILGYFEELGRLKAIIAPRAEHIIRQSEGSENPELKVSLSTGQ